MKSPAYQTRAANAPAKRTDKAAPLLSAILKACLDEIVLKPDELTVHVFDVLGKGDVLDVCIDPSLGDVKRIIGTNGAHIRALRQYAKLWGEANGISVTIRDFSAPKENRDRYPEFEHRPDWPKERLIKILREMSEAVLGEEIDAESADLDQASHIVMRYRTHSPVVPMLGGVLDVLGTAMGKRNGHTISVHLRPWK